MAAENGYASQLSYQLYDTTGTTEDWSYYSTGGLGFTFEIGPEHFHPPFAETVAEYEGGNRAAYYLAQENTADATKHAVLDRPGAGRRRPAAEEDVPDADVAGHDVHRHARQHDAGAGQRALRVARQPVDPPARRAGARP